MSQYAIKLLPEEDAIDDPDEEDDADPLTPGDLWYFLAPHEPGPG